MVSNGGAIERPARKIPGEGDDNLYTQSWFPVCLSSELDEGQVVGRDFLGGRVIAYRGQNGDVAVLSAFCAHLGVDLACGHVVDNMVRCPYHHFYYDQSGKAAKIGNGETPPPGARLFKYPTIERYGLVLAFNGEEPLFDFPGFSVPDDEIYTHAFKIDSEFQVDPWVVNSQTADVNHTQFLHGTEFAPKFEMPEMDYEDHSCGFVVEEEFNMDAFGTCTDMRARIYATNIIHIESVIGGMWTGAAAPMIPLKPGLSQGYGINAVRKADVNPQTEEAMQKVLNGIRAINEKVLSEDQSVYSNMRFVQGTLLKVDKELARYLDYVRAFPRANPGEQFINGEAPL